MISSEPQMQRRIGQMFLCSCPSVLDDNGGMCDTCSPCLNVCACHALVCFGGGEGGSKAVMTMSFNSTSSKPKVTSRTKSKWLYARYSANKRLLLVLLSFVLMCLFCKEGTNSKCKHMHTSLWIDWWWVRFIYWHIYSWWLNSQASCRHSSWQHLKILLNQVSMFNNSWLLIPWHMLSVLHQQHLKTVQHSCCVSVFILLVFIYLLRTYHRHGIITRTWSTLKSIGYYYSCCGELNMGGGPRFLQYHSHNHLIYVEQQCWSHQVHSWIMK